MKPFVRAIVIAGALSAVGSGLMAAQTNNNYQDQYFKAKYGRQSPQEEARLSVERANTAFREETGPSATAPTGTWMEHYFKAKLGRNTPAFEARLKAERENTAFREEPSRETTAISWFDQWYIKKFGRAPGR